MKGEQVNRRERQYNQQQQEDRWEGPRRQGSARRWAAITESVKTRRDIQRLLDQYREEQL